MPGLILSQNTINLTGIVSQTLTPIGFALSVGRGVPTASSVAPELEMDFSQYTSLAQIDADGTNWQTFEAINATNGNSITLDTSVGFGTSTKSLRMDWVDRTGEGGSGQTGRCGSVNATCSRSLKFLSNGAIQELWVEGVFKTTAGFRTTAPAAWGCTSDLGYKHVDGNVTPGDRFSGGLRSTYTPPTGSQYWAGYPDNVTDPAGKLNFSTIGNLVDGNWHTVRFHWKISTGYPGAPNADGAAECWIDGVLQYSATNIRTTSNAGNVPPSSFYGLALGRTMNQGPDQVESLWWGRVRQYRTNPGW